MQKRKVYSFSNHDLLLIGLVLFTFVFGSIFFQGFFTSLSSSGFDVAEIQAACGTTQSCNCGDQLGTSRVLNASDNLKACSTQAVLQISSSHVELDCNGQTLSGNGSASFGVQPLLGLTNITIKNCNFFNISGDSINFIGTGNNSFVINNNFSEYNKTNPAGSGVVIGNDVSHIVIQDNIFNTSSTNALSISINSGNNITIFNNTFRSGAIGILIGGPATNIVSNVSISANRYLNHARAIRLQNMTYLNVTVRNENVTGLQSAINQLPGDYTGQVVFINTSLAGALTQTIGFNLPTSSYTYIHNLSSSVFLFTQTQGITFGLNRNITLWSAQNITLQENTSIFAPVNYTLLTPNTVGGYYIFFDDVFNISRIFNSQGDASGVYGLTPGVVHNISIIFDTTPAVATLVSPIDELSAGVTSTVLNITTDENSSCRYGTSNVPFSSLTESFTSITNRSHYATLTSIESGTSYTYYVGCQDRVQNTLTTFSVNFSEASAPVSSSPSSDGGSGGGSSSGTSSDENQTTSDSEQDSQESGDTSAKDAFQELANEQNGDSQQSPLSFAPTQERMPSTLQRIIDSLKTFIFGKDTQLYFLLILVLLCFGAALLLRVIVRRPAAVVVPVPKTMKEYYASFKALQQLSISGSAEQKKYTLVSLEKIQKQFTQSWLRTSTRIRYSSSLEISHGSTLSACPIPDFSSKVLSSCTDTKSLSFLQLFFGTRDDLQTIQGVLTFISGKAASEILIVLPPAEGRVQYPERLAGLDYDKGYFRISASGLSSQGI